MVSPKGQASADETSGNPEEGNTGYVPFFLDLPKELESIQRLMFDCARYGVLSDTSSSTWTSSSSDSEDLDVTSLLATLESERKDPTPALDTQNPAPIQAAVIPDNEAIESPQKVAPVVLSEGYKPHNGVEELVDSAGLVDSSETCEHESMEETPSTFISPIVGVNTTDSTGFETKQLSHKMSDAEDPLEAHSDSEESCPKSKLKDHGNLPLRRSSRLVPNTENLPLRRSNRLVKQGPNTENLPLRRSSRLVQQGPNTENLPLRRSNRLVQQGPNTENLPLRRSSRLVKQGPNTENLPLRHSNRLLKQGPNTTEKPVPKRKAMEAAPGTRRSKRIRDLKSNTTRETNKRKRSNH